MPKATAPQGKTGQNKPLPVPQPNPQKTTDADPGYAQQGCGLPGQDEIDADARSGQTGSHKDQRSRSVINEAPNWKNPGRRLASQS
jgi:hypothetical protein